MSNLHVKCKLCQSKIPRQGYRMTCIICLGNYHMNCITLCPIEQQRLRDDALSWYCSSSNESILTFNHNKEDIDFLASVFEVDKRTLFTSEKIFHLFELNESETNSRLIDIDPDVNFFNEINHHVSNTCNYYLEDTFQTKLDNCISDQCSHHFSICHHDIRSVKKNLDKLETYLNTLGFPFSIVALSETWLLDTTCTLFNLPGHSSLIEQHRRERTGGGVGLFIKDGIQYFERPDLKYSDDSLESVFIEVDKDSFLLGKNIVIGVIYRPSGTEINLFNKVFKKILIIIQKENKFCYSSGDYNLNILNSENHTQTADFVDLLYSSSYIILITRPTRITQNTATLIDNVFTNNFQNLNNTFQGILVTDLSDHSPIFTSILPLNKE